MQREQKVYNKRSPSNSQPLLPLPISHLTILSKMLYAYPAKFPIVAF